jgi:hypothetical protein
LPGNEQTNRILRSAQTLLNMPGLEITAVISVQDTWNSAYCPARFALAPDGLMERQGCLQRRRRIEREKIPGDGAAVIIHNDRQPGSSRGPFIIEHHNIQQRVIGLPDGVRGFGFTPVQ